MKTLIVIVSALAGVIVGMAIAVAHAYEFTLAPGTYAIRSLCPTEGGMGIAMWDQTRQTQVFVAHGACVANRFGITFDIPPGPTLTWEFTLETDAPISTPKVKVERDCAEGVATTCVLTINGSYFDTQTATGGGRFSYPADVDWFRIPDDVDDFNSYTITPAAGCFASGKEVFVENVGRFLQVIGGPTSCTYKIVGRHRPTVD